VTAAPLNVAGRVGEAPRSTLPPLGSDIFGQYGAAVSCASAVLLLLAIATIDRLVAGVSFAILYLLPVAIVTWVVGRAWGFIASLVATALWLMAFHATHVAPVNLLVYGEAALLLGTLSVSVFLIARLRDALESSNERLVKVLEELDAPVYVADPQEGAVLYGNRRFREGLENRTYDSLALLPAKETRIRWPDGRRVVLRIL
jgi:hypothetical protein